MTVYVDEYMICQFGSRICHLFTFDEDPASLHELAGRIGLKRSEFQVIDGTGKAPWHNRYNIDEVQRLRALGAGAEVIGLRHYMDRVKKLREINGAAPDRGFGCTRPKVGARG